MKIKFKNATSDKTINRLTKKIRIRKTVNGTSERPRLCVYRSGRHMYAQVIDDVLGKTVVATSTLALEGDLASNRASAEVVGKEIAKLALAKNIKTVVFDRNGFIYHGRIKSLADGARSGGLNF